MKNRLGVLLLSAALASAGVASMLPARAQSLTAGPSLVQVTASTQEHRRALLAGRFDLAETRNGDRYDVVLWPGDAERLRTLGMTFRVLVADLSAHDEQIHATATPGARTRYRTLDEHNADLRWLAETYPDLVTLVVAPHRSLEGRQILGVEITAGDPANGRPTTLIDGLHHAREWPAAELVTDFALDLARGYGVDARITTLLDRVRILLVPVVNPDGFVVSRESPIDESSLGIVAGGQGAYWRKNTRGAYNTDGRSLAAYGTDPNRNYGFMWGSGTGGPTASTSAVPFDQTYQGSEPFSEPETQNIRDLTLERNVLIAITNHTYGRLVLYPWGHTSKRAPDGKVLEELGFAMAAANGYTPQTGYDLYPTTGTSEDWIYATTGALAYTIESFRSFHPPYGEIATGYEANKRAFLLAAEASLNPSYHSTLTGTVLGPEGTPIEATLRLTKTVTNPLSKPWEEVRDGQQETIDIQMRSRTDGVFRWHVNPSRRPLAQAPEAYTLTVSAPGAEPVTRAVNVTRGVTLNLGTIQLPPA